MGWQQKHFKLPCLSQVCGRCHDEDSGCKCQHFPCKSVICALHSLFYKMPGCFFFFNLAWLMLYMFLDFTELHFNKVLNISSGEAWSICPVNHHTSVCKEPPTHIQLGALLQGSMPFQYNLLVFCCEIAFLALWATQTYLIVVPNFLKTLLRVKWSKTPLETFLFLSVLFLYWKQWHSYARRWTGSEMWITRRNSQRCSSCLLRKNTI